MTKKLLFLLILLGTTGLFAQNLHDDSNAASIENEANTTTGWNTSGNLTSSTDNPFQGSFAISLEASRAGSASGRDMSYSFNAVVGEEYNISIWARQGNNPNSPAFANWFGFTGFSTTAITSGTWTEYTWTVTATNANPIIRIYTSSRNASNVGDEVLIDNISITVANSDAEAPSAITDLSSSNTTMTGTDLSWSASTDNVGVSNYEVFQDGVSIGNTGTNTTFNVTGLAPNTSYDFTVFAEDVAGNVSLVSNTETVNTLSDSQAPTAVTDLSSTNTTSTTTSLSWSTSADNIGVTNYEVFQDGVSIGNTGTNTTFNVTGLTASTSYDFTVFAEDAAGNTSLVSNTETVNTLALPDTEAPTAISDLSSSTTTSTTTDLSWSASTDNVGVTNYEVFQDGVSIANTGTATTFNVTGLAPATGYDFTVFAEDAAGNTSLVSNTETVNTLGVPDTEAPSAIVDLASSNITSTGTTLAWSPSTDNIGVTNYEVFQDGVSIANTGTTTSLDVTGLSADTSYDFTVFAEDAAENVSAVSNLETVTTSAGTGFVDYTSDNSNLTTVDWSARDLFADRNIGIGTTDTQGYRLAVAGNVISEGVKVELQGSWPDFVFEEEFNLLKLEEVRKFIKTNGHLPNIPSEEEVKKDGIDLGQMDARLLQKIEELTLYLLSQEEEIKKLKKENTEIKDILIRLDKLEHSGTPKQ
ncbi:MULTISPECIES: fibronectin type III domain-containing protein [Flavobacteriaceae]|uniref:fibronectin type III domain-containing protein n=1 Tax=Flavobacteriaceae TaxID=49546 RepID=UPI001491EE41|nr:MULTISPECIES: fibronectin type III domain-containing protein [Allomuricauda]MDC6366878.1 fibronectin type III domain-containing protein [Muricauda sp. AC10]